MCLIVSLTETVGEESKVFSVLYHITHSTVKHNTSYWYKVQGRQGLSRVSSFHATVKSSKCTIDLTLWIKAVAFLRPFLRERAGGRTLLDFWIKLYALDMYTG